MNNGKMKMRNAYKILVFLKPKSMRPTDMSKLSGGITNSYEGNRK
jgi:hypothetical protein